GRQHDVVARVHSQLEFGVATVGDPLPDFAGRTAAADVVVTAVAAVQAGGIESGAADAATTAQRTADGGRPQPANADEAEQPPTGLLQGGEVGDAAQTDGLP